MRRLGRTGVHSLATRLTIWVSALFALLLGVSLFVTITTSGMIRTRLHDLVLANLGQADVLLSSVLRKAHDVGYLLSTNANLVDYAEISPQPARNRYREYELISRLALELSRQADADPDVWSIYVLFADGGQTVTSDLDFRSGEFLGSQAWTEIASAVTDNFSYIGHYFDASLTGRHYLAVVTRANIVNRRLKSRVRIMANIDERSFYDRIDWLRATDHARVYLLDEAGTVICAADEEELGRPLDAVVGLGIVPDALADVRRLRLSDGGMHLVVQRRNELTGWRFVVLLPERELLREQRELLALTTTLVSLASLLLAFAASRIVGLTIRRPIATLVGFMERAERESFRLRIDHARRDELGYLFDSFNDMVARTRRLLDDLEQEHRLKHEMELKLLQSRMNPHFLYNTLDMINWIAQEHGVEDISRIVLSLSDLYRTMFNRGRDVIEVARMMQSLESYLYLQTYRCSNLVTYSVEADSDARECLVLNLVVQPVVENAVIHGMGRRTVPGNVSVRASREGGLIRFRVADTGAGIGEDKLATIRAGMESSSGDEASGLRNVHRRLQLVYGPGYGIQIWSEEGRGTTVEIVMPVTGPLAPGGSDTDGAPA
jgi:sensor histidine kinase YesM